ncbi:carbamoyltransferase [Flagellimonas meridianipacifica]|uniref:Carbamoyltransferase n=1 Tax=Flagellimonas meridianipacifica TaxID=1080225 RepID=A0A2T0M8L0_9FLAO|nr:carbamoyltransferase [Allomuricauda pacifica]PRX53820.1 carbamoyltransferase [Allomuricauda pacifica]
MATVILGFSAFFHDSAVALLIDGEIVAAAQEERFTRIKGDASFPKNAIAYVLQEANITSAELDAVAFYEKPLLKFERLLENYHAFVPKGLKSFLKAMPLWLKDKLFIRKKIKEHFKEIGFEGVPIFFPEHHLSHAASAFYPSPFDKATILTVDGVGEWNTMTIGMGDGNSIKILREQHYPHSLGLLYSAFTYFLGFKVNSGEYKVMGLASYGNPDAEVTLTFVQKISEKLVDVRQDGSLLLNMDYFDFAVNLTMTKDEKWQSLFGLTRRKRDQELTQKHANLALAVQLVLEECTAKLVQTAISLTGCPNLVMAGGVALNSVNNGKLLKNPEVGKLWIQPAAGDAGGALGAALAVWHIHMGKERKALNTDHMNFGYLGPAFTQQHVFNMSKLHPELNPKQIEDEDELLFITAKAISEGQIVGWFQGRMEFGPRALGNRSILADPRNPEMQRKINSQIKFRESFRPFAPSVLEEDAQEYFELDEASPYMLLVQKVKAYRLKVNAKNEVGLMERLSQIRSDIPSVTHVDCSARIQTVSKSSNPLFWKLLKAYKDLTGYGILINTSFNVKDEPIVCTPADAIRCFKQTGMDILVLGNTIFTKPQKESLKKEPPSPDRK